MNPNEITCSIHTATQYTYSDHVDYNCTVGSYRCADCDAEYWEQEAEYDRIAANVTPSDPTDRAAWYARRDARLALTETAAADQLLEDHENLIREMQATFRHDHALSI